MLAINRKEQMPNYLSAIRYVSESNNILSLSLINEVMVLLKCLIRILIKGQLGASISALTIEEIYEPTSTLDFIY
jgi:hypothetical protein